VAREWLTFDFQPRDGARRPMTYPIVTLPLAAAMLSLTAVAHAHTTSGQVSACIGDAFRYCSSEIPSSTRVEACLISNKSKLTPSCRAQFDEPDKHHSRARPAKATEGSR
jgi:hypothetical protein